MARDPRKPRLVSLAFLRRRKLPTATVLGHIANQDKFALRNSSRWSLPVWVLPTLAVASLVTLVILCFQVVDLQGHKFNPNDVVAKARSSTFEVSCGGASGTAVGINVPVPDGYKTAVFSAAHIFDDCKPGDKIDVVSSGRTYKGVLFKKDPVGKTSTSSLDELSTMADIALIYMRVRLPTLDPAPSGRVGDWVVEIGNPLGQINYATSGIITKITDNEYYTDAPSNHGNSGGPLLDSQARVLGVMSWVRLIAENEVDPSNKSTVLDQVHGMSAAKRLSNACSIIYSASPRCPFRD
jgi:S1-C subfamily serine protease